MLTSYIFIPELNYWINQLSIQYVLNKNQYIFSANLNIENYLPQQSFIELLFNENWNKTQYDYLYRENNNILLWPSRVRTKLMLYPKISKYYECGNITDSIDFNNNLFFLESDDFLLLDKLLEYRLTSDSTSDILYDITYSSLTTILSKLIYLYLDLKLNNNFNNYNNVILLSDTPTIYNKCLLYLYESYLVENYFNFIQNSDIHLNL